MTNRYLIISYGILKLEKLTLVSKLVLSEIINLSKMRGYCFARDKYIGEKLGFQPSQISRAADELLEKGLVFKRAEGQNRILTPNYERLSELGIYVPNSDYYINNKNNNEDSNYYIKETDSKSFLSEKSNEKTKSDDFFIDDKPSYDIDELMKIE